MPSISCADFTFPVPDRATALKLIKLLGFRFVDIGLFARNAHFSPGELLSRRNPFIEDVRRDLAAGELEVSDVFLQIGTEPSVSSANDPDADVRARNQVVFQHAVEFCVAIGCGHMTGLPGIEHDRLPAESSFALAAEAAHWRTRLCAEAGVIYSIEPHIGSICQDVASTQRLLAAVAGLTLTLDYGHFVAAGEQSSRVDVLLSSATHIHVRGGAPGRLQTSVRDNAIDFSAMMTALKRMHYDGFLALEYVWSDWMDCNRTDNVSETLLLRRTLEHALSI